jgi:hypothetical protein
MIRTVLAHLRTQWMGALALFLVLVGGTAYAADTIGSSDIINGQVKTADIGNNQVRSADVRDDALTNGGLTGADIVEGSLGPVPNADTLDGKDSKDFARLGGLINGDGSTLQGSGFTVSHPNDGEYQISFPSGTLSNANCPPVATAMVFSGIVRHPQITGRTCSGLGAGSFTIKTLDNDGVAHDTPFVFMGM